MAKDDDKMATHTPYAGAFTIEELREKFRANVTKVERVGEKFAELPHEDQLKAFSDMVQILEGVDALAKSFGLPEDPNVEHALKIADIALDADKNRKE
jgi:hypothetical protein